MREAPHTSGSMQAMGTQVLAAENAFDPRIGFQFHGMLDYDVMYMCVGVTDREHHTLHKPYPSKYLQGPIS